MIKFGCCSRAAIIILYVPYVIYAFPTKYHNSFLSNPQGFYITIQINMQAIKICKNDEKIAFILLENPLF